HRSTAPTPRSTLRPCTTLFRSAPAAALGRGADRAADDRSRRRRHRRVRCRARRRTPAPERLMATARAGRVGGGSGGRLLSGLTVRGRCLLSAGAAALLPGLYLHELNVT